MFYLSGYKLFCLLNTFKKMKRNLKNTKKNIIEKKKLLK